MTFYFLILLAFSLMGWKDHMDNPRMTDEKEEILGEGDQD